MRVLMNAAVEPPEREFTVEFIAYGSATQGAAKRTIKVLARTSKGAAKIVRHRYYRSGEHRVLDESYQFAFG